MTMDNNEEELENMTGPQWTRRLMEDPALADKCDWRKLDEDDWKELLDWQPQFAAFKPAAPNTEKTEMRRHGD